MTEYICVLLKGIQGSEKYKLVSDIILYDSPWKNLSGLERFKLKWIFLSSNCNQTKFWISETENVRWNNKSHWLKIQKAAKCEAAEL